MYRPLPAEERAQRFAKLERQAQERAERLERSHAVNMARPDYVPTLPGWLPQRQCAVVEWVEWVILQLFKLYFFVLLLIAFARIAAIVFTILYYYVAVALYYGSLGLVVLPY